jgi:hypothetical protein
MAIRRIERDAIGGRREFRMDGVPQRFCPAEPRKPRPDSHSSLTDYGAEYVHDSTFCVALRLPVAPVKPT